jgi:pseudouridine-5'-phosphate glycosidase
VAASPASPGCSAAGSAAPLRLADEVRDAVAASRPVVALESTIIAHGLPRPRNLEVALALEEALRERAVVPATIAVLDGVAHVGLDGVALERIAAGAEGGVAKLGLRDLAPAVALRVTGATTVSATAHLAALAGIRVFATGGLGGVHPGAASSFDESADLVALARTPIVVVASGVKSILDVGATLERLETLGVTVLGFGTDRFAGFVLEDAGFAVPWTVSTPAEVAAAAAAALALRTPGAIVVANPVPPGLGIDAREHDRALAEGLRLATDRGVEGKAITPFLLEHLHRETEGRSLEANVALALANAALAGDIAAAWAAPG